MSKKGKRIAYATVKKSRPTVDEKVEKEITELETEENRHKVRPGDFCTKCGHIGDTKKTGKDNFLCRDCRKELREW